jgi:hypothetical protein
MTKKKKIMFEDSLKKWKWIKDNYDYKLSLPSNYSRLKKDLPFLTKYKYLCSFCTKYWDPLGYCPSCPLSQNGQPCSKGNSFYAKWELEPNCRENGKKYAKKMYNLIKKLYKKELKK